MRVELKNIVLLTLIYFCISCIFAQKNKTELKKEVDKIHDLNIQLTVYRNALICSDYYTAIIALNYVVALEASTGKYRDSLAFMYDIAGNYHQALYWSEEVLKNDASNIGMMEVKANCLKQTNSYIKAIEVFDKLVQLTSSPIHAFNLIELQYQVKRLYECVISTELADKLVFTDEMKYSYKIDEKNYKNAKLISAFYNFRGLALFELGSKEEAKLAFEKSIAADTSFLLARINLNVVINDLISEKNSEKSVPPSKKDNNTNTINNRKDD